MLYKKKKSKKIMVNWITDTTWGNITVTYCQAK